MCGPQKNRLSRNSNPKEENEEAVGKLDETTENPEGFLPATLGENDHYEGTTGNALRLERNYNT